MLITHLLLVLEVWPFKGSRTSVKTVLVASDNSTVVAYINKQGGTQSAEMCALLWKIMTWCHHYQITLKAGHIPGCLNLIANLLSRLNQVQSTEWSLHLHVFKQICHKWSTVCVSSPRPKCLGHKCSEHKLVGSHCLCLPSDGSPSQGDLKIRHSSCLIIVIAPGWPGMSWFLDLVQLSTEIPLQLLHAWCLGVDSSRNKASLWRWQRELLPLRGYQQGPSTSGPYLRNGAKKIRWISPSGYTIRRVLD